eukprot:11801137-Alexandrium_andersonii.AAC.1
MGPRSSRRVRFARFLVQIPNLPTNMGIEEGPKARNRETPKLRPAILQSAIRAFFGSWHVRALKE